MGEVSAHSFSELPLLLGSPRDGCQHLVKPGFAKEAVVDHPFGVPRLAAKDDAGMLRKDIDIDIEMDIGSRADEADEHEFVQESIEQYRRQVQFENLMINRGTNTSTSLEVIEEEKSMLQHMDDFCDSVVSDINLFPPRPVTPEH